MKDHTDPVEAFERHKARFKEAKRQFYAEEITEAVLKATLYSLGFRGQELEAEVNLILMEARDATKRPESSGGARLLK